MKILHIIGKRQMSPQNFFHCVTYVQGQLSDVYKNKT